MKFFTTASCFFTWGMLFLSLGTSSELRAQESEQFSSKSSVFVFKNYLDDVSESISSFAMRRKVHSNGEITIEYLDPNNTSAVLFKLEYDSNGIQKNDLGKGLKNESVLWFLKNTPEIGQTASTIRRTKNFGRDRSKPPTISEYKIVSTYLRTEVLEVLGKREKCHVVDERATIEDGHRDIKWLDESGMPLRIVHIVGDETRTTLLVKRVPVQHELE